MWWTSSVTLYFCNSTMMRPKIERKETDLVYSFYNTVTVVEESENSETKRYCNVGPNASKAICTTFNSLKVMCLDACSNGQRPESTVSRCTVPKCAPYPKSLESVKSSSWGSDGSQDYEQYYGYNVDQKYFKER
jgi:hypothetical protein